MKKLWKSTKKFIIFLMLRSLSGSIQAKLTFKKVNKWRNFIWGEQNFSLGCFSGLLEFWSTFQISTKKYAAAKFCSIFTFLATQKLVVHGSGFNESGSATWLFASCYENIPRTHNMVKYAVLRFRIRNPVLFEPLDRGSGIEKVLIRIRNEHPRLFFRELRISL